ncbi:MAG: sugar phosphate isomerase/epimerase family protein [Thermoguttaceae bacterium]
MNLAVSRRRFLTLTGAAVCAGSVFPFGSITQVFGAPSERPFRVGICDWDLKETGTSPKSFAAAKELGFEGVEVSFSPDGEFSLRNPENYQVFLDAAKEADMEISSLAMGVLNGQPLATVPEAEDWVRDCIKAMTAMNVKNSLIAFFSKGDLNDKPDAQEIVVEKFKRLAPDAEKSGRILGIESYLDAATHLKMLDKIASDAVKVYYDERNMYEKRYPIYDDLETLLKEKAICQVHVKEYNHRLGKGKIDFARIRDLLEKYDYRGWLVVESSVKGDWKESHLENSAYLKDLFSQQRS